MPFIGNDDKLQFIIISSIVLLILTIPSEVLTGLSCLSNPCFHGVCIDNHNSTYFCYCIDGYTGIQCQTNWDECWSSPCRNGGICIDGIASFNCTCPPGFVGEFCEEDFNECESNPCLNNGTCLDGANGYNCTCPTGYSGIYCEIDVAVCNATNETRCENGGVCVEGSGNSFTCNCKSGWEGFLCNIDSDECASALCQNGGICIDLIGDYTCACAFGYTGRNCEDTIQICDINPCSNGALCLEENGEDVCYCVPDFHGDHCQFQYDECQIGRNECKNGGTCIDGVDNATCVCPPTLTGIRCECLVLNDNELDCAYVRPTPPESRSTSTAKSTKTLQISTSEAPTTRLDIITANSTTTTVITTVESTTLSSGTTTEDDTTLGSTLPVTMTETIYTTSEESTAFMTTPTTVVPDLETTSHSTTSKEIETTMTFVGTTSVIEVTSDATVSTEFLISTTEIQPDIVTVSDGTTMSTMSRTETSSEFSDTTLYPITITAAVTYLSSSSEDGTTFPYSSSSIIPFFTKEPDSSTQDSSIASKLPFDCSKSSSSSCQNGGTCIYSIDKGYKCVCPFDAEGDFCQILLGVKKAAFTGNSYLRHRSDGTFNITMEFNLKTLASEGVWFFSYVDKSYMALYTENGYLKFKFSCGYQTMLLSELNVPVNTGFLMKIKAVLEFSRNLEHCDASIRINESLAMTGDQIAVSNKLSRPVAWLHLGRVPEDFANTNIPISGFVGCMMNMKVLGRKIDIFKDADDGFGVTECSTLACLSNPCSNGATCHSKGDEWTCNCRTGFLGKMCELSVCANNPCLFGGTCIPFSGSGYICLCPFGKHGHFCENDLKVTKPNFSSTIRGLSSYVAYPIPGEISENMEIRFKFSPSTIDQISILMFIGQRGHHDFYSDHMAVSFVKGYIMLTWNLGSGPRRIFTSNAIKSADESYSVRFGLIGRRAWLHVENLGNVTGRSPGYLVHLNVNPILYIGGHDSQNFSTLPHDLPLHTGFSGCIFDVKLVSDSVIIPLQGLKQTTGRATGQCGTTECYQQSCQNDGACLHHGSTFMCLCQDNWFGPLCTSKRNPCDSANHKCGDGSTCVPVISDYECDCPPGKTGKYCDKLEDITDVRFGGKRSYLAINSGEFENNHFNVEFELRPLHDNGLILFFGRKTSAFLSLSLENGSLDLKLSPGENKLGENDPTTVLSSKLLIKGLWHKIQLGVFGKKAYLSVDNVINSKVLVRERGINLSKENIYIGGLPDLSHLPQSATSILPINFNGNINDCDGTPCGKDACLNGGSCWLDSFLKTHCSCPPPYQGNQCESIQKCDDKLCKNTGKCDDSSSRCYCKVGYSGAFCENQIKVTTPEFTGKSYLIVESTQNVKNKRNVRDVTRLKNIYLNFTTVKNDGLLILGKKSKSFIGVGLERGFLKIAYFNSGKSTTNQTFVDVPSYHHLSDGLWHSLEINFVPFGVRLDRNLLPNRREFLKSSGNSPIPINRMLFIGGIPLKSSIWNETNGIYSEAFEGCIEGFAVNDGKIIKDFTNFEGAGIDLCSVF